MFNGWRTVVFFVLTALVSVAGLLGFYDWKPTGDQAELIGLIVSVVGLVLRYFTKTEIFKSE